MGPGSGVPQSELSEALQRAFDGRERSSCLDQLKRTRHLVSLCLETTIVILVLVTDWPQIVYAADFGATGTARRARSIQRGLGAKFGHEGVENQRFLADPGPGKLTFKMAYRAKLR